MMGIEEIKNAIKEATVRISVIIEGHIEKGTGVLLSQNDKYYVLTVYHCIFGKEETPLDVKKENIELEFHDTISTITIKPSSLEPISDNIVIMEIDNSISKPIEYECLDRVLYDQNYHIRGFPTILEGTAHFFEADCKDNDLDTIGFSIEVKNLTSDTSGDDAIDYIAGISGSGVFFSEHDKLYLVGLVNEMGSSGGVFNRVDSIKLIDINKSDVDIQFSDFFSIDNITEKLKIINREIAQETCERFEGENMSLYQNLNRKHTNIFHEQEVYEKNFRAVKNYLSGKNSVSEMKLLNSSFENDLISLSQDILDDIASISKYIETKKHGQDNLQRIEDKTLNAVKEELRLVQKNGYISNKLQEYLVVGWLLNCSIDFILDGDNGA